MASFKVIREIAGAIASGLTDPQTDASWKLRVAGGFIASGMRFASGTSIGELGPRPDKTFTLWDDEASVECRVVREALSELDLDAEVRPCPEGGSRFLPELQGEAAPRLYDPNVDATLLGATNILNHLYGRYGRGTPPFIRRMQPLTRMSGGAARWFAGARGRARPSKPPKQPLELWSFEASPYCRFARLSLCELELPWLLHNIAKGSPRRPAFIARVGKMQVPYLNDPNTGEAMFESAQIGRYLLQTYGA